MQDSQVDIVIIKGAPGSGKSSIAKCLSEKFPKGIRLEVDTIRSMVISVDWTNQTEHINMLGVSAKLTSEFLSLGHTPVIVVDTFSGDKVVRFIEQLKAINDSLIIKVFGLYSTEEELRKRVDARKENEFRDVDICLKLNADVIKMKLKDEVQIDTTGLLPNESAKTILLQL